MDIGRSLLPEHAVESRTVRAVTYNLGQGGRRDAGLWLRLLGAPLPDLLFVQESRDPAESWLTELRTSTPGQCLWEAASDRWGTGLCVHGGRLVPLQVPPVFRGRVVAAVVEGLAWPLVSSTAIAAISIHCPTAKGSSYIREMGRILDFVPAVASGLPLILGGDFNVAVALRAEDHPLYNSIGERMLLARLRDELGLLPCWQAVHPGEAPARTLRWMRRLDSLPYHCDGLFVPSARISSLLTCEVLEDEGWCALSDHNPVVATFASANTSARRG